MGKLVFYFGAMGSGKTEHLIRLSDKMHFRWKNVLILKSSIDTRSGQYAVESRNGKKRMAIPITKNDSSEQIVDLVLGYGAQVVLVDEVQFLNKEHIDGFIKLVDEHSINVAFYGLLTDFRGEMFDTSKYIMENADEVYQLEVMCRYCKNKAIRNTRFDSDGSAVFEGSQIVVGGDDIYKATCRKCYNKLRKGDDPYRDQV